jgi:hypothetical protein
MRRLTVAVFASALVLAGSALAAKPPGSGPSAVTIGAAPGAVVFGSSLSITGQVTGKKAGGARVDLQDQTGPNSFATVTSATADSTGHYTFKVAPAKNTVYRVIAHTAPAATSSNVAVTVLVKVTLGVSTTAPKAGSRDRFFGFVLPAYDGKLVQIQQKTATGWRTVGSATLQAATPVGGVARSKYSKRLKVGRTGTYRAFFNPADGQRLPNQSATKRLVVH